VRIPPKELLKRPVVEIAIKRRTALTGAIPQGPRTVAMNREKTAGADTRTPSSMHLGWRPLADLEPGPPCYEI
jgi:hypothetical protein